MAYGQELILDLIGCHTQSGTRSYIEKFLEAACVLMGVEREELHWWDYGEDVSGRDNAPKHMAGTSGVQFISKSNITFHYLDHRRLMMLNVFSCGEFHSASMAALAELHFGGKVIGNRTITRGETWSA